MTFNINEVVSVQVTLAHARTEVASFNKPLIVGPNGNFDSGELVRAYANMDEVGEDFSSSDPEYLAANAVFAQEPKLSQVLIGVEDPQELIQTLTFSADIVTGNSIALNVDGVTITQAFSSSHADTMAALEAQLEAQPLISTVTVGGAGNRVLTITAAKAGVPFIIALGAVTGGASQATMTLATTQANVGIADSLSDIIQQNDSWYALIWTNRDKDYLKTVLPVIESRRKIFITASSEAGILSSGSTTDIASIAQLAGRTRSGIIYNADPDDFADAAWLGKMLAFDAGVATWWGKTLAGITADSLTSSQRNAAFEKKANTYETGGGVSITRNGTMASGIFIDNRVIIDFLQARMEEAIYRLLVTSPKIPMTDGGIASVENQVRLVLENARVNSLIAEYSVTVPRASAISQQNKSDRILPDVKWTATLAGAAQKVIVNGTLSV